MPRADKPQAEQQLAKVLLIGDGKCGKSDWAARAIDGGFNILYMDADVASQTIQGLPTDKTNPVPAEKLSQIYVLNCADTMTDGGIDFRFVETFKHFTNKSKFVWNDSEAREYEMLKDGDKYDDVVWEIYPAKMNHNDVLVIDSWTALAQSAMCWAADEAGIDLAELDNAARGNMRSVYQMAGEKLTQFLVMIRSMPCHVIVIAHPTEFVKTERPNNQTVKAIKEGDLKVLWTKMMPKSTSNNHAMTMAKYFTDLAWLEVDAMGEYKIDYRASADRLSGSHFNERLGTRGDGSFQKLVEKIGGTIPGKAAEPDWIIEHDSGYEVDNAKSKPSLVLGAKKSAEAKPKKVGGLKLN